MIETLPRSRSSCWCPFQPPVVSCWTPPLSAKCCPEWAQWESQKGFPPFPHAWGWRCIWWPASLSSSIHPQPSLPPHNCSIQLKGSWCQSQLEGVRVSVTCTDCLQAFPVAGVLPGFFWTTEGWTYSSINAEWLQALVLNYRKKKYGCCKKFQKDK